MPPRVRNPGGICDSWQKLEACPGKVGFHDDAVTLTYDERCWRALNDVMRAGRHTELELTKDAWGGRCPMRPPPALKERTVRRVYDRPRGVGRLLTAIHVHGLDGLRCGIVEPRVTIVSDREAKARAVLDHPDVTRRRARGQEQGNYHDYGAATLTHALQPGM